MPLFNKLDIDSTLSVLPNSVNRNLVWGRSGRAAGRVLRPESHNKRETTYGVSGGPTGDHWPTRLRCRPWQG